MLLGIQRRDQLSQAEDARAAKDGYERSKPDFEELYRQYFSFVWRIVRHFGVSPALSDDAVQEVFLVVFRHLDGYQHRGSPKAWLFPIAQRVASDYRRRARRKGGLLPMDENLVKQTDRGPFEAAAADQASRIILEFLDTLDDNRRAVFILAELEQWTAAEISAALRVNTNTVYSRIRSARRELVSFVSENYPDGAASYNG